MAFQLVPAHQIIGSVAKTLSDSAERHRRQTASTVDNSGPTGTMPVGLSALIE